MWKEFFIWEFRVVAKVYQDASRLGIEGLERVSKLSVYRGKEMLYNYDRGLNFSILPDWLIQVLLKAIDKFLFIIHLM